MDAPSRRERKQQESAQHIAEVAMTLFGQHGYDAVSMEDIAREADVAKGTLYKRFPVKEAILAHHFQQDLQQLQPLIQQSLRNEPDCPSRLRAYFRQAALWSQRHRAYLRPWLAYRYARAFDPDVPRSGAGQALAALLAEGVRCGEIRNDIPLEELLLGLEYLHSSALMRWLSNEQVDLGQSLDHMLTLFLQGSEHPSC